MIDEEIKEHTEEDVTDEIKKQPGDIIKSQKTLITPVSTNALIASSTRNGSHLNKTPLKGSMASGNSRSNPSNSIAIPSTSGD